MAAEAFIPADAIFCAAEKGMKRVIRKKLQKREEFRRVKSIIPADRIPALTEQALKNTEKRRTRGQGGYRS